MDLNLFCTSEILSESVVANAGEVCDGKISSLLALKMHNFYRFVLCSLLLEYSVPGWYVRMLVISMYTVPRALVYVGLYILEHHLLFQLSILIRLC